MDIKRAGTQRSSEGPSEYFTGVVRIDPLFEAPSPSRGRGANVTFEPGARSAWHTHPLGQTLIVMAGVGITQCWGEEPVKIRPGDVVWCPPGKKHWHGASPTVGTSASTWRSSRWASTALLSGQKPCRLRGPPIDQSPAAHLTFHDREHFSAIVNTAPRRALKCSRSNGNLFTLPWNPCSRSPGNTVHHRAEYAPLRMSVAPAASHTFTPAGSAIIAAPKDRSRARVQRHPRALG
jgi:quercetin dioxygenase-like cupin family protein